MNRIARRRRAHREVQLSAGMARASGGTMEHLEYFELPADPFQNDADARFYYESAPQKRARLRLLRGIHQRKALSVLVGGPGLGKTTLAHMLLRELEGKDYARTTCRSRTRPARRRWFLPNVARAFGVPMPSPQVGQLVDQIHAQLVAIVTSRRAPVLLIDEAQLFRNREAMEEFRGLLNLLHGGKKLLSMVLFGLPELDEVLKLDEPLAQRVEIRVEMTAMDWLESQAYVSHRLRLAGAKSAVFAPDALEALFRWSARRAARAEHAGRQLALRGLPHRDQAGGQPRGAVGREEPRARARADRHDAEHPPAGPAGAGPPGGDRGEARSAPGARRAAGAGARDHAGRQAEPQAPRARAGAGAGARIRAGLRGGARARADGRARSREAAAAESDSSPGLAGAALADARGRAGRARADTDACRGGAAARLAERGRARPRPRRGGRRGRPCRRRRPARSAIPNRSRSSSPSLRPSRPKRSSTSAATTTSPTSRSARS